MEYIPELKCQIIQKFGKSISTKTDANALREHIMLVTSELISESTIRRFFGLIPQRKTSITTLNILSNYLGFSDYNEFVSNCNQKILDIINQENSADSILIELEKRNLFGIAELNLLANYLSQLIIFGQQDDVVPFFENEHLYQKIISNKNVHDFFSQKIGAAIDHVETDDIIPLLSSTYFSQLVLHRYIDIGNEKMGLLYKQYLSMTDNPLEINIFNSILALNSAHKNDFTSYRRHLARIDFTLKMGSPEYNGRLSLLNWILDSNDSHLMNQGKLFKNQIHLFSIDIIQYGLLQEKFSLLRLWLSSFPELKDNRRWVSRDLNSIYQIADKAINQKTTSLSQIKVDKINIPTTRLSTIYRLILAKLSIS